MSRRPFLSIVKYKIITSPPTVCFFLSCIPLFTPIHLIPKSIRMISIFTSFIWPFFCLLLMQHATSNVKELWHQNLLHGLPWWLSGKESTCKCRRNGFDPWSLIQENPTCLRATKPMHHNYWAYALEPKSCKYWSQHALELMHSLNHWLTREVPQLSAFWNCFFPLRLNLFFQIPRLKPLNFININL